MRKSLFFTLGASRWVSCHQKVNIFNLLFQFLTVWAETLHGNRTLFSQQSCVFGFLILTVFGAKMTSYDWQQNVSFLSLITFNFKLLHRRLPTNCFLKKVGLRDDDKCSFCNKETENLIHLFWRCEKTKNFWDSLFKWMQSCQLSLGEHNYLHINTALGLRPDRSKHKLQINFCCLIAKHHIWLCRLKEHPPNLNNFLLYLKHIYQIENNASTVKNKWEPLLPYISLLTWVSKT